MPNDTAIILGCGHTPANRNQEPEIKANECSDCLTIRRYNLSGQAMTKLRHKAFDRTFAFMEPYFARR